MRKEIQYFICSSCNDELSNSQYVYSDGWRWDSVVGTVASVDKVLSIPEFARTNGGKSEKKTPSVGIMEKIRSQHLQDNTGTRPVWRMCGSKSRIVFKVSGYISCPTKEIIRNEKETTKYIHEL